MERLDGTPMGCYGYGSLLFLVVFTIVISIIFACFSFGFIYFLLFWLLYIVAYSLLTEWTYPTWRIASIAGLFFCGLFGFIIGRLLIGDHDIFDSFYDD